MGFVEDAPTPAAFESAERFDLRAIVHSGLVGHQDHCVVVVVAVLERFEQQLDAVDLVTPQHDDVHLLRRVLADLVHPVHANVAWADDEVHHIRMILAVAIHRHDLDVALAGPHLHEQSVRRAHVHAHRRDALVRHRWQDRVARGCVLGDDLGHLVPSLDLSSLVVLLELAELGPELQLGDLVLERDLLLAPSRKAAEHGRVGERCRCSASVLGRGSTRDALPPLRGCVERWCDLLGMVADRPATANDFEEILVGVPLGSCDHLEAADVADPTTLDHREMQPIGCLDSSVLGEKLGSRFGEREDDALQVLADFSHGLLGFLVYQCFERRV